MLVDIKERAREDKLPITLDDTLSLLVSTIRQCGAKDVLEIGTCVGYSALAMSDVCEHIDTVELDADRARTAVRNISDAEKSHIITVHHMDARDFLDACDRKYDFVYLDGPKGQYIKYLPKLIEILNINGIIFADNVYFKGMVNGKIPVSHGVKTMIRHLREYLDAITHDDRLDTTVLDIGDGVSISRKIKE